MYCQHSNLAVISWNRLMSLVIFRSYKTELYVAIKKRISTEVPNRFIKNMYHFEKQSSCQLTCVYENEQNLRQTWITWHWPGTFKLGINTVWMSHRHLLPIASSNENRTVFPWAMRSKARFPIHLKPVKVSYNKTRPVLSIAMVLELTFQVLVFQMSLWEAKVSFIICSGNQW